VLAASAQQEFGGDRDHACGGVEPERVGAQQEGEREAGDQGRTQVERRDCEPHADDLREQRSADGDQARQRPRAKIDQEEIEQEQYGKRADLQIARVR